MNTRLFVAATLSLALGACAPAGTTAEGGMEASRAPAPAASVNPVGRYEFTTTVDGNPITGAIEVSGTAGAYTGQITTSITPPIPVTGATATGQELVVTGSTPDGTLTLRMTFTDATAFTGGWELAGDTGTLTGRRTM